MLSGRDEDLCAGNSISAIALRLGLGADHAQIGAAMRLCQVHRARPFARNHLGQVKLFLLLRSGCLDRRASAIGKAGIHRKGLIGGAGEFLHQKTENMRQTLATELLWLGNRAPPAFNIGLIGFLEAIWGCDRAIFMARATLFITNLVDRSENFRTELAGFVHNRINHVLSGVFKAGQIAIAGQIKHFVDDETRIACGGGIGWHHKIPFVVNGVLSGWS
mmetsp:Transcript_15960/g.52271  ORF Transcript_15960/g.52271 Transcript_15960/m.52271 type:complete len:219 (-) Transcript_15960:51-707(-)